MGHVTDIVPLPNGLGGADGMATPESSSDTEASHTPEDDASSDAYGKANGSDPSGPVGDDAAGDMRLPVAEGVTSEGGPKTLELT